ncbi:MAG: polysaccharide deacetylase family protein [Thermaerobacter sp.]|nr:polysaccharide deacetylase family protein [Thermaerobacter sp.]
METLSGVVLGLFLGYQALPELWCHTLGRGAVTRGRGSGVALTFDDGPHPEFTPRVIELLGELKVRATFFLVGARVAAAPELVRRLSAAGHELANHGFGHRHAWTMGPWATRADIARGRAAILDATGREPAFYRPPWGFCNLTTRFAAGGQRLALWSVAPGDWLARRPAAELTRRTLDGCTPGAVVLLHDAPWGTRRADALLEALPFIVAGLRERGLEPVPLGELAPEVGA